MTRDGRGPARGHAGPSPAPGPAGGPSRDLLSGWPWWPQGLKPCKSHHDFARTVPRTVSCYGHCGGTGPL